MADVMKKVKLYMTGRLNCYAIASMKQRMREWDEWLRHRIRTYSGRGYWFTADTGGMKKRHNKRKTRTRRVL